ncbi:MULTISPECIES: hypothetical protein [unclassified Streptomyces]|uniref:hypothetical protein n=1 Tax=unclassified Streptomyces TaxID=2593676 RepID=UPI00278C5217|nr:MULTISPECIES: hypothetical protein [unclassified Streptomyces]
MTTTLERLAAEPKHDPALLVPNVWSDFFHRIEALCPCGGTAGVRDGALGDHDPLSTWNVNMQRVPVITDAFRKMGFATVCRYSGRTVTLAAALARDEALTPAEKRQRDVTRARLEQGVVFTAPEGWALPKIVASLFALAEDNGWATQQAWIPGEDGFTLKLRVSRPADDELSWQYDLDWFVAPGVARRDRSGMSRTPDRPVPHDTPSVKKIREAIAANPVPEGVRTA